MNNRELEKLEVLDGSRNREVRRKAAVRIEDVAELLNITKLKTQTLAADPTMADFNSLLADLREISDRLNSVAAAIQQRLIR
ncbi:hypothetical protein J2T08_003597 [Neorhizobium galegae]|uniref:hypothetical protein n=1 Tax=Neorhizobium galegae TaxID=399 RepID=UPI002782D458|nr:hypothetical protein [Neorhizobium galegae]MDQ0135676.1 hypothetical protein [Neorhizobium galegae]